MGSKPRKRKRSLRGTGVLPMQRIDFDVYADTVREAKLEFLIAAPSQAPWKVASWEINSVVLQYVAEGGSKILHGISRPDALLFVFQHQKYFGNRVIFDGHVAQPYDIAVLPPSSHFSAATFGPHQWFSVSLPVGLFGEVAARVGKNDLEWIERDKCVISTSPKLAKCLTAELVKTVTLLGNEVTSKHHSYVAGIEISLLNSLITAIAGANNKTSLSEKAKPSRKIMRMALEHVRRNNWRTLLVSDLARAARITERTLHRSFNQQLGIGPARYLKLRQLNIVRRALRSKLDSPEKVSDIMCEIGVSEFGRFAGEYRALFGESPSKTRRRHIQSATFTEKPQ
jgi:AraC family transcriptional regulator, ethanolamine operon transcriptional activator